MVARATALSLLVLWGCGSTYKPLDLDGDGYTVLDGDCWDAPDGPALDGPGGADIHPGAEEVWYDGVDQDCDDGDDYDQDGDGHDLGEADCDDLDAASYVGAAEVWYDGADQNCDGLGDSDQDGDGHDAEEVGGDDCDDEDPGSFPGAAEIWYDGVDEACDGGDDDDQDGDGHASDDQGGDDCDDLDPDISPDPSVVEVWYDGVDQDCDGNDGDKDGDGYVSDYYVSQYGLPALPDDAYPAYLGAGDCWDDPDTRPIGLTVLNGFPEVSAEDLSPGADEVWYDGVDEDCAGDGDFDQDGDGFATAFYADAGGEAGSDCIDGSDLDDPDPGALPPEQVYPGAVEIWYDGTDADCGGDDDYDQDADGYSASAYGVGSADDCDDTLPEVHPGVEETCTTSYDDDCDGDDNDPDALGCGTFYADLDGDDHGISDSACLCEGEAPYTASVADDCDDADPRVNPSAPEVCDDADVDEDCDGQRDDADPDVIGTLTRYHDGDGDGYGDAADSLTLCDLPEDYIEDATDCDDGDAGVNPDASEVCDGADVDEDCDGLADDADPSVTDASTWYTDADSDGYGDLGTAETTCEPDGGQVLVAGDCDDGTAARSPGNAEVCDDANIDEDCDGLSDDDDVSATGQSTWYRDADRDGYGSTTSKAACDQPTGYVADDTDCDDADADVSPGLAEVCDDADVDEDCDGLADDLDSSASGMSVYYKDGDGDGYGLDATAVQRCDRPTGYATIGGECDDAEPARYPGAVEDCSDGVVNACDETEAEARAACSLTGHLSADAERRGFSARDDMGLTVAGGGDVDGDGYGDVWMAATGASGGVESGIVYMLRGPLASSTTTAHVTYAARLTGTSSVDQLGYGLDGGIDLDNDGYDDAVLGAPGVDVAGTDAGAAYVVMGPVSGSTTMDSAPVPYDAKLVGALSGESAGYSAAMLGDTDLDGYAELLVGAPYGDGWGVLGGAAYVVSGPPSSGALGSDAVFYGADDDEAGIWVGRGGDLDGDGYADALVGAPWASRGGAVESGVASVFLGPLGSGARATSDADLEVQGVSDSVYVGFCLAGAFDENGDGYDDLLIGAPGFSYLSSGGGAASLVVGSAGFGGSRAFTSAGLLLPGEDLGDYVGNSVAGAGDVDGDGYDDVLIGADYADADSGADEGQVFLFYGPITTLSVMSDADADLQGGSANALLGVGLAGAGDTNGDGYADFLAGAPGWNRDTGYTRLVLGGGF